MKSFRKIVSLTLSLLLLCSCGKKEIKDVETRQAIIFDVSADAQTFVMRDGKEESAFAGMRLVGGDVVSTDDKGCAYIRVDDDKNIILSKRSSMEITKLESGKLLLTLLSGEFFFDVENKLSEDEQMSFVIGSSTMSIRGTSGGGKTSENNEAVFMILTGLGVVSQNDDTNNEQPKEYSVVAGSKITVNNDSENREEIILQPVTVEDIPQSVVEYIKENETYQSKMEEQGYEINLEEGCINVSNELTQTIVQNIVENNEETEQSNPLLGYRQNKDGSWTFHQEDYDNNIGPTYYVEEKPQPVIYRCASCGLNTENRNLLNAYNGNLYCSNCFYHTCQTCNAVYSLAEVAKHSECEACLQNNIHIQICDSEHMHCEGCGACMSQKDLDKCDTVACLHFYCNDCLPLYCSYTASYQLVCPDCLNALNDTWEECYNPDCHLVVTNYDLGVATAHQCALCGIRSCLAHSDSWEALSDNEWVCDNCRNSDAIVACDGTDCANKFISYHNENHSSNIKFCNDCGKQFCPVCAPDNIITTCCATTCCLDCAADMETCHICHGYLCHNHTEQDNSYAYFCSYCNQWTCWEHYNLSLNCCNDCTSNFGGQQLQATACHKSLPHFTRK